MKLLIKRLFLSFSLFFISATMVFGAQIAKKAQVQIKTAPEAIALLRNTIINFPFNANEDLAYQKRQSDIIIRCAKILCDNVHTQLLDVLSEIDRRIAYWQYQKDHPWNYFISKNPSKWFTGPKQEEEIEDNLETLKSCQGELYVRLGQLSEIEGDFIRGYKDTFLSDYQKGYEWVDKLIDALPDIDVKKLDRTSILRFVARLEILKAKFENMNTFKNNLLADISETEIPGYVARNWLKSAVALTALGYGYNTFSLEQIQSPLVYIGGELQKNVVSPVQELITDVFLPGGQGSQSNLLVAQSSLDAVYNSVEKFLTDLAKPGLVTSSYMSQERKEKILKEVKSGQSGLFQELSAELSSSILRKTKALEAKELSAELLLLQAGSRVQRTIAGLGKIAVITPALLFGWGVYTGYQKLTEKSYAPFRRALVDINSLLVDVSQPLTDEQQGNMIYLVHTLKKRAEKELPTKNNVRADFIHDLERIQSPEFNVATKRAMVEDMFKKYPFLGFVLQK